MSPMILLSLRRNMRNCQVPTEYSSRKARIEWARKDWRWAAHLGVYSVGLLAINDMHNARLDNLAGRHNTINVY